MKHHRFIGDFDLNQPKITIKEEEILSQWRNVLRFTSGHEVILCDGKGNESIGIIEDLNKKEAIVKIQETKHITRGTKKNVVLYASILRRENFELVVQKATEMGVSKIIPMISARTVKTGLSSDRLKKIILEAGEQSGRTTLPVLGEITKFEIAISSVDPENTLLFDISGERASIKDFEKNNLNIFIGPEGGWENKELELAKSLGIKILSLGDLTLRGETASIAVLFMACMD